jgi:thiol:disulfide interchange protein
MRLSRIIGFVLLGLGLLVFLIRLHHPGAYWFPEQGNLRAALASLAIGAWLVAEWLPEHPSRAFLRVLRDSVRDGRSRRHRAKPRG